MISAPKRRRSRRAGDPDQVVAEPLAGCRAGSSVRLASGAAVPIGSPHPARSRGGLGRGRRRPPVPAPVSESHLERLGGNGLAGVDVEPDAFLSEVVGRRRSRSSSAVVGLPSIASSTSSGCSSFDAVGASGSKSSAPSSCDRPSDHPRPPACPHRPSAQVMATIATAAAAAASTSRIPGPRTSAAA